jgi:hypothetical protein
MKEYKPPIRSDRRFYDELMKIQLNRINLGKEKVLKPMPLSKITLAITKHKLFPKIKEDIINEFQ